MSRHARPSSPSLALSACAHAGHGPCSSARAFSSLPTRSAPSSTCAWPRGGVRGPFSLPDAPFVPSYDGPPFATGLPHHGHLLMGSVKVLHAPFKLHRIPGADRTRPTGRRDALCALERLPRRAPLRLGHARPPGRARDRQEAWHHLQGGRHGHGHRQVQRRVPRHRHAVRRRVAPDGRAPRSVDRL